MLHIISKPQWDWRWCEVFGAIEYPNDFPVGFLNFQKKRCCTVAHFKCTGIFFAYFSNLLQPLKIRHKHIKRFCYKSVVKVREKLKILRR